MATSARQLSFPTSSPSNGITSGFRDSAFTRNRELPIHRWVPWIAGFSAPFVDDCLAKYLPPDLGKRPIVLDPFAGVGTTLLQSYLHGCAVLGFEINPYAALAARTKLEAARLSVSEFQRHILAFDAHSNHSNSLLGRNSADTVQIAKTVSALGSWGSAEISRYIILFLISV